MLTRRCVLKFGAVAALCVATAASPAPLAGRRSAARGRRQLQYSRRHGQDRRRGIQVTTLVGPDGDAHVFEPTPADARAIADAKVVFINGLGLEQGWMPRLIEAAGYKGPVMVTSKGIKPLRMEEEDEHGKQEASAHERGHGKPHMVDDPHAWQNLANGKLYVENIVAGLSAADPAGAETYRANGQAYLSEIDKLDAEVEPSSRRSRKPAARSSPLMMPSSTSARPMAWHCWLPRG